MTILTVDEVIAKLRLDRLAKPRKALRMLCLAHGLPRFRLDGGRYLYDAEALEEWPRQRQKAGDRRR